MRWAARFHHLEHRGALADDPARLQEGAQAEIIAFVVIIAALGLQLPRIFTRERIDNFHGRPTSGEVERGSCRARHGAELHEELCLEMFALLGARLACVPRRTIVHQISFDEVPWSFAVARAIRSTPSVRASSEVAIDSLK